MRAVSLRAQISKTLTPAKSFTCRDSKDRGSKNLRRSTGHQFVSSVRKRLAVLGPGLLGGSILLRNAQISDRMEAAVWARRASALDSVRALGVAEFCSDNLREIVAGASLVVLCTPIGVMPELAEKIAPSLAADAVVTDVGSVKGPVVQALEATLGGRFVGSHPMAGSECDGLASARPDLYDGAVCLITPTPTTQPAALKTVEDFWSRLGCRTVRMEPALHDIVVAKVSHLPHLAAACLAVVCARENGEHLQFSGPGFRDSTRIARGPVPMWTEILMTNREAVIAEIDAFVGVLEQSRQALASGDSSGINLLLDLARSALTNSVGESSKHV